MIHFFPIFIIFCLLTLIGGKWLWNRRKLYSLSWKMDGPIGLPFVGSALALLFQENLDFVDYLSNNFETPLRLWLGTKLFVYLDNVEDIEVILNASECINREDSYQYLKEGLGVDGIFTLEDRKWKQHRKFVGPSFNYNIVLGYLPVFNRNSTRLIKILEQNIGKGAFDIRLPLKDVALNSFLEATLGLDISDADKTKYGEYITIGQQYVSKRIFQPWYQLDFLWNLTKYSKYLKECRKFCSSVLDGILTQKLKEGSEEVTMIERLIRISEQNESFTLENVKAEAVDALTAASDTSAWAIAFVILMLAMHPECQDRAVAELKEVTEDKDTDVTRHILENLHYLEMCIMETMRLYPVVPLMARKCSGNVKLRDFEITPGINIAIGVRQIHRKSKYWGANPHTFNPDHFLPENIAKRNPYCYLPFSAGPRNCIGNRYAMIVMKCLIANLLRHFKFTTPLKMNDLKVRMDINIFLKSGSMVEAHPRNF